MSDFGSQRALACLFSVTCLLVLSIPADAGPSLTPLDTTGWQGGIGLGVSNNGVVVGDSFLGGNDFSTYWSANGTQSGLPFAAVDHSDAYGISADGSTIVGSVYDPNTTISQGYAYTPGAGSASLLPLLTGGTFGEAHAANANGTVIVGNSDATDTFTHAVMWTGANWATVTTLGDLGGNYSLAWGVSANGAIVVGESKGLDTYDHAYYWQSGVLHEIDLGTTSSAADAISADGSTIVGTDLIGGSHNAISLTGPGYGTRTDLGTLGGTLSAASATNSDGSVIVGQSFLTGNSIGHAFRYANGSMADLNTLLASSGVNMTGIVLTTANAISPNGDYIAASNTSGFGIPYLVYYSNGIGGITTAAAQQKSIDQLGHDREKVAVQQDAYTDLVIGDLDPVTTGNDVGVFGLYGSAVGGLRARGGWNNWTFSGGISGGEGDYDALSYQGLMAAAALRYDFPAIAGHLRPFAQIGGSFGLLTDLSFTRHYANGAGSADGEDSTSGHAASVFGRLGFTTDIASTDQLSLNVEIGERWLTTNAYSESQSSSNPFPASFGAATDTMTVGKLAASWTHDFSPRFDMTLRGAVATSLSGTSGLQADTTGFGAMSTSSPNATWGEAGVRIGWKATTRTTLDLYAMGIAGENVGTAGHVGAGVRIKF